MHFLIYIFSGQVNEEEIQFRTQALSFSSTSVSVISTKVSKSEKENAYYTLYPNKYIHMYAHRNRRKRLRLRR